MISRLVKTVSRSRAKAHERRAALATHTRRVKDSEIILRASEKLRHQAMIRFDDISWYRSVDAICRTIEFLELADRDLEVLAFQYFEPWPQELFHLHARVQAMILYEIFMMRGRVLGKDLRSALSALKLTNTLSVLNEQNRKLAKIEHKYKDQLHKIRNTVTAHRDYEKPRHTMVLSGLGVMVAVQLSPLVQACLQKLATALMQACEEIAGSLPQRPSRVATAHQGK